MDTSIYRPNPRVVCKDGFSLSIQASAFHYCSPRENISPGEGSYAAVEIGFPSETEELILEYAEEPENPTETVYPCVPAQVVREVIRKHGGIESGKCPPLRSEE